MNFKHMDFQKKTMLALVVLLIVILVMQWPLQRLSEGKAKNVKKNWFGLSVRSGNRRIFLKIKDG